MIGKVIAINLVERHFNDSLTISGKRFTGICARGPHQFHSPFIWIDFAQRQFHSTGETTIIELRYQKGCGRNDLACYLVLPQCGKSGCVDDLRALGKWIEFDGGKDWFEE